jgi:hypothetical protein
MRESFDGAIVVIDADLKFPLSFAPGQRFRMATEFNVHKYPKSLTLAMEPLLIQTLARAQILVA